MGKRKPVGPPPSTTAGDVAEGLARAVLSIVPIVGGPTAELFGLVIDPVLHRRSKAWLGRLAEVVDDLQAHGVDVRTLEDNELLVTVILNATQAAARTHEQEKLEVLRNAITNSALGVAPEEHVQLMFVRFIDEFTTLHLHLLAYLRDPPGWFDAHSLARPTPGLSGSRSQILEAGLPELSGRKDLYMQAVNELAARGLAQAALGGLVTAHGAWDALTTPFGNQFLDFISRPR